MPFAETSTGARLHYEHLNPQAGGIPVILLHGLLGTGRTNFAQVIDWLVGLGYEVYAPSLRGYGESEPKPRDFPFRFYERDADDIIAWLHTLNIQKAHILGYSDGGEVALIVGGKAPERCVSIATIGSTGYFDEQVRIVVQGYRPGSMWITADEMAMHQIPDADAFARGWQRSMLLLVDSGGDSCVSLAPKMTMPVLLMLGDKDRLNPRHNAQKLLDAGVPKGRIQMFEAGHPVHEEQTEQFKTIFLAHMQSAEKTAQ